VRIRSALARIKRLVTRRHWEDYSVEEWNRQYTSSSWKYLASLEQVPRYAIIEGWRRRLKPAGSVLDLGCGEGALLEHLPPAGGVTYTGVDLSQVAIDVAVTKIRDESRERFVCADLRTFEMPAGSAFDVIVFNEVLYYLADPVSVVQRYRASLATGGLVIVSIFHENDRIWKVINQSLASECLQTTVVNELSSGKSWYLGVYQARPTPS
jgi:2-polyprenyl-3-methyl-5-hydroxy-6-metoxy-1,4-benzoquinol methylase